MKFQIVEVSKDVIEQDDEIIGHAYAIQLENTDQDLLNKFLEDFATDYEEEIGKMIDSLHTMVSKTGFRIQYFKENEGALGDGMVALSENCLRLYGLRFDNTAIFFGSGGYKPSNIKAYQDDKTLNNEAQLTRKIVAAINNAIKEKELRINDDGSLEMSDDLELEI